MSRPFNPRHSPPSHSFIKVNGRIRAREVRVIGADGHQLGIFPLAEAITMARQNGVDLVEVAPNATPPVCRLVDFGRYRYEQAKKEKEARKHQHANKVKEIQLSPTIDPHDFAVKLNHAIEFLCDEMKVKVTLRFRGREMAHKEFGFQTVEKFMKEVGAYGHPDAPPKLIGKGINLMISPLPRNKRAKNPRQEHEGGASHDAPSSTPHPQRPPDRPPGTVSANPGTPSGSNEKTQAFGNNPFSQLEIKVPQSS